jgi:photosystem II stability/assembly factor-like uncharacterized protein
MDNNSLKIPLWLKINFFIKEGFMNQKLNLSLIVLTLILLSTCSPAPRDGQWRVQYTGIREEASYAFKRVQFVSPQTGWVLGIKVVSGQIVESKIKGTCPSDPRGWCDLRVFSDPHFFGMYFTNATTGWLVGDDGRLAKTTNGGSYWQERDSRTRRKLVDVFFINQNTGWAVGDEGTIIHSTDGGDIWAPQNSTYSGPGFSLTAVRFQTPQSGWVVGYCNFAGSPDAGAIILHTIDGGRTWVRERNNIVPGKQNTRLYDLFMTATGWVYALGGNNGALLMTSDDGQTWISATSALNIPFNAIYFPESLYGWIVGNNGKISMSRDAGRNWQPQPSSLGGAPYLDAVCDIYMITPELGYAVAARARILKYEVPN